MYEPKVEHGNHERCWIGDGPQWVIRHPDAKCVLMSKEKRKGMTADDTIEVFGI